MTIEAWGGNKKPEAKKLAEKKIIVVKKESDQDHRPIDIEQLSLQHLGAYMLWEDVTEDSTRGLAEFIIKANYVFPSDQPLTLIINSPGGNVYDGFGVIDLMECSRIPIKTVAIGCIMSMAVPIFTSGTRGARVMAKNAYIMTHQFSTYFEGKYHELVAQRPHDDDLAAKFIKHFLRTTKMTEKQIKDILLKPSDAYLTPKEALKYGICDSIHNPWS